MNYSQIFCEYLKKHDLKNTTERLTVLQVVLAMDKHFDVESLIDRLKSQQKKISRATVYRTMELLVDCGLVTKHRFGENGRVYEPKSERDNHDHFLCVSCGKIIEFYDPEIEGIHQRLCERFGVEILDYSHQLYGKCNKCSG